MTPHAHLLTGRPTSELWFLSAVSTLLCVLMTADCGSRPETGNKHTLMDSLTTPLSRAGKNALKPPESRSRKEVAHLQVSVLPFHRVTS